MNRTQIRVLLVEDEVAHAELIGRSFEPHEGLMSLDVASTLAEARTLMESNPPDLVLIDLLLPDGKGTELLPAEGSQAQFPIIIMTSHGNEKVAVEAMKAGALHYVVKSASTLTDMPQIVEGALREWGHVVERRKAEEALQSSEEHFRSLIENAQDIILVVDPEGMIRYTSPAIERVLGYSPTERIGSNFYELIHPEDRGEVIGTLMDTFESPGAAQYMEYRHRHRDGSVRVLEAMASSRRLLDGPLQAVINARDVTDRKQAQEAKQRLEDQLRHSQKWQIIGTLAGGIANEFNNMLTPILGFASLALDEASEGSKIRRRLERIMTAANRSKDLAEQLLVFSQQAEPQREAVYVHEIVEETLKLLRPTLPPSIEIQQQINSECDPVDADPDQIRQMLMNLCTNAHHAMPEGGVLSVSVDMLEADAEHIAAHGHPHEEGSYVHLSVSDTGHGMDADTRERMLEPFFTTKDESGSSGLGLAVTHGIVVSHGGELWVESELEQGTVIHICLPRAVVIDLPDEIAAFLV